MITDAKSQGRHLGVLFIDFSKAFDTIGHDYLFNILRYSLPAGVVELIKSLYTDIDTVSEIGQKRTGTIRIGRGVKKGDPLSPLLFTLAVDPLLRRLEATGLGASLGAGKVASVVFADDTALPTNTAKDMQSLLNIVIDFGKRTGLKLNVAKCEGFMIKSKQKTFFSWTHQSSGPLEEPRSASCGRERRRNT